MPDVFPPVTELLPHAPPLVLLDQVIGRTDEGVTAQLMIRREAPFFVTGQGIPAHIGIEYMAQACGVFAGLQARLNGHPVKVGFLLGTRRYQAFVAWLLEGWQLTVTASVVFREGQMGVFDCRIRFGEIDVATAQITVYQPDDAAAARTAAEQQVE